VRYRIEKFGLTRPQPHAANTRPLAAPMA
jgi:hypothetical protein